MTTQYTSQQTVRIHGYPWQVRTYTSPYVMPYALIQLHTFQFLQRSPLQLLCYNLKKKATTDLK